MKWSQKMKCDDCQKNKFLRLTLVKNIKICFTCYVKLLFKNYKKHEIILNDVNWSKVRNE